jgi:D-glycerate 3-kinase
MPEPLPHWQNAFLEQHQLPVDYLESALKWFAPVAALIAGHQSSAGRPLLIAVNGSQGSGKTTLCDYLASCLENEHSLSVVSLSLDDFYLTRAQRQRLAAEIHPLLATRGVPGTHDMGLMAATIEQLLAGGAPDIPRFDKSVDDRLPQEQWHSPMRAVDVILLEGWCLGATAQPEEELVAAVNPLESKEDPDGSWRHFANGVLKEAFPPLYARVDEWIMLRAPSFDCVYRWRLEQEHKLAARRSGEGVMSDAQVARFIQFYQRITEQCLAQLPHLVNHLFSLDEFRLVNAYMAAPGKRL